MSQTRPVLEEQQYYMEMLTNLKTVVSESETRIMKYIVPKCDALESSMKQDVTDVVSSYIEISGLTSEFNLLLIPTQTLIHPSNCDRQYR